MGARNLLTTFPAEHFSLTLLATWVVYRPAINRSRLITWQNSSNIVQLPLKSFPAEMQFQKNWQTKCPFTLLRRSLKLESWIILLVQFFHNSHLKHTVEVKQFTCKRNCKNGYLCYYHFQIISLGIPLCTFPGQTCKVCCNLGKEEIVGKKIKGDKKIREDWVVVGHISACQTTFQLYSQNIQQHHP